MVIIELKGGLGNQLFQYAAGLALSEFHKTGLKVDISNLKMPDEVLGTYRRYVLSNLQIPPVIATEKEGAATTKKYQHFLPTRFKNIFKEKHFHYNSSFWKTNRDVHLKGNFQSDKYFRDFRGHIKDAISFEGVSLTTESQDILEEISGTKSLAIHVRRGDYVTNKIANDVLGTLPISYYEKAYQLILSTTAIEKCFIISDDIQWAEQNMGFIKDANFVNSNDTTNKDIVEFYLMQHCTHNIIANSSFSWWAAYLNPNPNKIVIAPERWFNKAPYDTKDLYPAEWLKV
jgi:hypothetical protein